MQQSRNKIKAHLLDKRKRKQYANDMYKTLEHKELAKEKREIRD